MRRINNVYFDSDTFYNMWDFASAKSKENAGRTRTSYYYWRRCHCTYHFRRDINLLHTFWKNCFTVILITSSLSGRKYIHKTKYFNFW